MGRDIGAVVVVGAKEFNDDSGRVNDRLYREVTPDFEKVHREGLRAAEYLKRYIFKK